MSIFKGQNNIAVSQAFQLTDKHTTNKKREYSVYPYVFVGLVGIGKSGDLQKQIYKLTDTHISHLSITVYSEDTTIVSVCRLLESDSMRSDDDSDNKSYKRGTRKAVPDSWPAKEGRNPKMEVRARLFHFSLCIEQEYILTN